MNCVKCGLEKAQYDLYKTCSRCYRKDLEKKWTTSGPLECIKCGKIKTIDNFYLLGKSCKDCFKLKISEIQKINKKRYNQYKKISRYRNKEWIDNLKNNPCVDCGGIFPPCAMHFDHLPKFKKSFGIGQSVSRARKILEEEIAKCELVCANCHSIRTFERGQHDMDL